MDMGLPLTLTLCLVVSVVLTGLLSLPAVTRGYNTVMRGITRAMFRRDKPPELPRV